jgi:hypothetical protein
LIRLGLSILALILIEFRKIVETNDQSPILRTEAFGQLKRALPRLLRVGDPAFGESFSPRLI